LIGVATVKDKPGQRWKMAICDLLAVNTGAALQASLFAICRAGMDTLSTRNTGGRAPEIEILASPVLQPALARVGFNSSKYKFGFVIHIIDDSLERERVTPQQWYLSADD
jgi:hypothetical protein